MVPAGRHDRAVIAVEVLAGHDGVVARLVERHDERLGVVEGVAGRCVRHAVVERVLARQQRGARGAAQRRLVVHALEAQAALQPELADVGQPREDPLIGHVAQVVGHDDDDVRGHRLRRARSGGVDSSTRAAGEADSDCAPAGLAASSARPRATLRASARGMTAGQASKRRKTATAFWPPKPKPLMMAVSTLRAARHVGHVVEVAVGQVRVVEVDGGRR